MPRTRSLAWSELKIGIITIAALLVLIVVVFAVGGESGFFWQRFPLKARFTDVQGLKPGAVVRLAGKEIGTVTSVEFAGEGVEVAFEVLEEVRPILSTGTSAVIGSLSLLGEPIVDLKAGRRGEPLQDWSFIATAPPAPAIGDLTTSASAGLEEMQKLLVDIRSGRGTIGKIMTDDALYREMEGLLASATRVARGLEAGNGTLGSLLKDPAAYTALKASLENLQVTTAKINSGQGALGRLLNDEAMGRSISSTTANLDSITGKLSKGEGTMGKLLTDTQLYDRLNAMTTKIDDLAAGLNAGRGTAGQLLHDQRLYENINRTVTEMGELLTAIRKDPQKYLRVNVSIF